MIFYKMHAFRHLILRTRCGKFKKLLSISNRIKIKRTHFVVCCSKLKN